MRILLGLGAVCSAFVAPPIVTFLLMLVLSLRYAAWEVLFIGFLVDCLWFPQSAGFLGFMPVFTLAAIILVWGIEPLRKEFLTQ